MFALIRKISSYDAPDLFLGIFSSQERAESAREIYLSGIAQYDPWEKQSYSKVSPQEDCKIETVPLRGEVVEDSQKLYLVTSYFDGGGQISRRLDALFHHRSEAKKYAAKLEDGPSATAPNYCRVDEVLLDAAK